MFAFKSGDLQLFRYDEEQENLLYLRTETNLEHETGCTDIDCLPSKQIYVTGGKDGFVKVWNVKKELIREIKFPEEVYSVAFLNQKGDLLVGHRGKVSMVAVQDYAPDEIKRLIQPPDLQTFYTKKRKVISNELFETLRLKDEDIQK